MMGSKNAALWAAREQAGLAERKADDLRAEIARLREALLAQVEYLRGQTSGALGWNAGVIASANFMESSINRLFRAALKGTPHDHE